MSSERSGNGGALKVVIDTNVLVAAALHPDRRPAMVIGLMLIGEIVNYTSPPIIDEVQEVLDKFKDGRVVLKTYLEHSRTIRPHQHIHICRDPTDDKFIECAASAGAEFIISGDRALLDVGEYGRIRILTVGEFLSFRTS